jgi:hypothetical protein
LVLQLLVSPAMAEDDKTKQEGQTSQERSESSESSDNESLEQALLRQADKQKEQSEIDAIRDYLDINPVSIMLARAALKEIQDGGKDRISMEDVIETLDNPELEEMLYKELEENNIETREFDTLIYKVIDDDEQPRIQLVQKPETKDWSIMIFVGRATSQAMVGMMAGENYLGYKNAYVTGFEVNKVVLRNIYDTAWNIKISVGAAQHFEDQHQDKQSVTLQIKAEYPFDFFGHVAKLRFGEGITYASAPLEFEDRNPQGEGSKLLNHLSVEMGIGLEKFVEKTWFDSVKECEAGVKIFHRSGVFGLIDAYGNIHGGSNYGTVYLECPF